MFLLSLFLLKKETWKRRLVRREETDIREFKQIARAGATTAAVTEKVWGEYVSVVCQIYKDVGNMN